MVKETLQLEQEIQPNQDSQAKQGNQAKRNNQSKQVLGFQFKIEQIDKNTNKTTLIQPFSDNQMSNQGYELLYDVFFRNADAPTEFQLGLLASKISVLLNDITETDTEIEVGHPERFDVVPCRIKIKDEIIDVLATFAPVSASATFSIDAGQNMVDGETVSIGNTDYEFVDVLGVSNPYQVKIGVDAEQTILNFKDAVLAEPGTEGTAYSTGTAEHEYVVAEIGSTDEELLVTHKVPGADGNDLSVSESAGQAEWDTVSGYLEGGVNGRFTVERNDRNPASHTQNSLIRATHAPQTTMSDLYEISGIDYVRKVLDRDNIGFPILALHDESMEIRTREMLFENNSTDVWDTASGVFLCGIMPDSSEKFICWHNFFNTTTLIPSNSLKVTIRVKGVDC